MGVRGDMARAEFPAGPKRAKLIAEGIWGAHRRTEERRRDRYPVSAAMGSNHIEAFPDESELDYFLTGQALAGALFVHVSVAFDE